MNHHPTPRALHARLSRWARPCVFLLSLAAFFLGLSLPAAESPKEAPGPQWSVIGLSPFLDRAVKDEAYRGIVRLLVEDLPLNSNVAIYDAFAMKSVVHLNIPSAHAFNSAKTRANQFAPAIGDLRRFLAHDNPKPVRAHLDFTGALRLPQFCDFLAENITQTNSPLNVLLIGSPFYQDDKEPGFSMVNGYFPSDGHLQAAREQSVFGFSGDTNAAAPLIVDWAWFGEPWLSDLHKEKVSRFWALYLQRRGGLLASFSGDLPTALDGFRQGPAPRRAPARYYAVDPQQTKIEMLRVSREVALTDWITRDTASAPAPRPPTNPIGPMKIGIRWRENLDLDLYAAPRPGAETLFFQHPRSPEGYYYKDHRSSPGQEFEFIEFESPVDAREVQVFVNFYKGTCPDGPQGDVRIEFDGRIYTGRFAIAAGEGNRGRSGPGQEEFWTRIPVPEILKLQPGSERAGP